MFRLKGSLTRFEGIRRRLEKILFYSFLSRNEMKVKVEEKGEEEDFASLGHDETPWDQQKAVEWWPCRKKIHLKERANGTRAPLPYEIGWRIVLREARRMRDSMRGRTDHSPRPTLSEDPTLDRDNIPLAFFGTVAARSGPCRPSSISSLSYILQFCTRNYHRFNKIKIYILIRQIKRLI